jgi:hypothetical protein
MATYKFTVNYIHNSFIKANPAMHENHPDFIKASSTTDYELVHTEGIALEDAQNKLVLSLEADDCTVLSIHGVKIE